MITRYLVIIFSFLSLSIYSQSQENDNTSTYKALNLIENYSEYDFSDLLLPKSDFLGFIGDDFKRVKIKFNQIKKSNNTATIYQVNGKYAVDKNNYNLKGTINTLEVKEYRNFHYGIDMMYADSSLQVQGIFLANYELKAYKNSKFIGTYSGTMSLSFYVDRNQNIRYDDIQKHSDGYINNAYTGHWKSRSQINTTICNWGEYRIPNANDLDIGVGEFSINPKYYNKGWKDLKPNQN